MDTFTLPPSPTWHLSNILACSDEGLLAYGARNEVAIVDYKAKGNFNVSFLNLAHKEKINVVVFSPSTGSFKNCLATCADDGLVRVWDFKESRLKYCHSGHKDGLRVMGLDWSKADTNRIVSVNDLGIIVCWDIASNTIRRLHCGVKILPLCLACCPHDKELIAVGCKNGVTLVIDTKGNGKILHRLRGHEQDVISISWCPVPYNVIRHKRPLDSKAGEGTREEKEADREKDLLLATGGAEKSVFIWRTGTDGRFEVVLNLPTFTMGNGNNKKKGAVNSLLWTSVLWADPYTLLSTSQFGELLSWDLTRVHPISDKANYKKPQPRLLHAKHYKGCFSIATPVLTETPNKGDERLVWTTAMDKHVVACKLSGGSVVLDVPTMGGAVYCLSISPLDPSRLAIGSSDSKVFVWNIGDLTNLQITSYWKKIVGKVMALCWHPLEENWLAYGTSDGHVGLIDVGSNKFPTIFRLHHRKQVYRLCWAAPVVPTSTSSKNLVLYSVGDGDVLQYEVDLANPNKEPISLNAVILNAIDEGLSIKKSLVRSDVVFKPDNSCFVVGNENGSVYILSCGTVKFLHVLYPHKKLMNNLEWHPETVASDNSISPYKNWLAISCENIKVYNIPDEGAGEPELIATLNGHSMKIVGLAWSPHYNGRLLSASYDFTVQVWDVPSQSCLGVFMDHSMAVMSAYFSPLDPNIVISGSNDNTVRLWNISQLQAATAKPEKKRGIFDKILMKQKVDVQEATELTVGMSNLSLSGDENNSRRNTSANSSLNSNSQSPPHTSNKGTVDLNDRRKTKSMFSVTGPKLTVAKHFDKLYERWASSKTAPISAPAESTPTLESTPTSDETQEEESLSVNELGYLDFFGDDKSMLRLLMVEESHLAQSQPQWVQQSMLWRGDVSQLLSQAITKKQLSDWLVSLAPMAGFDMWEKACEAYSDQLVECGEIIKASSYLLQIHKVHEAVRLLADYKMFREAIAIAKCRLPNDELTVQVYTEWAHLTRHQGSLQLAAHCFLAAGNIQACIETLARDKQLNSLKMAATLASHHAPPEMASSLATECLNMAILSGNLAVGHQLISQIPQYKFWSAWLAAAEVVLKVKNRSEMEAISWITGWRKAPVSLWSHMTTRCADVGPSYTKLVPRLPTNKTPEFERDVWYYVSGQLAAAWLAQQETSPADTLRHLVSALSAAFHYQNSHPASPALLLTLAVITPNGLFGDASILVKEYETVEEQQLMKSLKAFTCAAVVHWLSNNWSKVSTLKLKSLQADAEEGAKEEIEFKVEWIVDLITRCSSEVLDEESILFFVNKAQKEELFNRVTKENIKKSAEKKIDIKEKAKNGKGQDQDGGENESCKSKTKASNQTDENLNLTTEKNELCPTVEHHKEIENGETKLSETEKLVASNKSEKKQDSSNGNEANLGSNGDVQKESATNIKANGEESSANLIAIKKLEKALSHFESVRVSVPSPFTAYANIKYLIGDVISKKDPEMAQKLQENCDSLWKKSQH